MMTSETLMTMDKVSELVDEYEELVAAYLSAPPSKVEAREDAIEAFEAAHPDVIDASYQRGVKAIGHKPGSTFPKA